MRSGTSAIGLRRTGGDATSGVPTDFRRGTRGLSWPDRLDNAGEVGVLRHILVGSAESTLFGALSGAILGAGRTVAQQALHDVRFVLELPPQGSGLGLDRF